MITPDGAEIYIADQKDGLILWQDLQEPHGGFSTIRIGQETGSGWTQGEPSRLVFLPEKSYRRAQIVVTDVKFNSIVFIDQLTKRVVRRISDVGFAPRTIVVTPDGRKAYIGSEQPIPTGSIAILDLNHPIPHLEDKRISVPSPEGMAIFGRRLYVATQSGGGNDPVFIVDTVSDKVKSWIPGFAVGCNIAIVPPYGKKIYVARGNYPLSSIGEEKQSPLGVIQIGSWPRYQEKVSQPIPLAFNVPLVIVTKDGKTALVANGDKITAIDTRNDHVVGRSINLSSEADGFAVSKDRVYVWLPNDKPNPRLFTFDLRSAL
ncbi:hypothetical protein [Leptospirillum ferriphilum]|uniref:hypothetical protein n=1 Tax=Leptospirillum ferriphilum TaxID=178606 RepID=UPI000A68A88E|nr:hypothetical protein [Leptospirillum ferriphilum]